jgi:hypothetical protein
LLRAVLLVPKVNFVETTGIASGCNLSVILHFSSTFSLTFHQKASSLSVSPYKPKDT